MLRKSLLSGGKKNKKCFHTLNTGNAQYYRSILCSLTKRGFIFLFNMCLSVIVHKGGFEKNDCHQSLIRHVNWLNSDFLKKSLMKFIRHTNEFISNSQML